MADNGPHHFEKKINDPFMEIPIILWQPVEGLFAGEETVEVELTNPRQATLDFQLPNA